jgi:hypothetical protein
VRNSQESAAIKVAILFGFATVFLTAVQVWLQLKDTRLIPVLENAFLVLTLLSLLGFLGTLAWIFMPWVRDLWAWVKRHRQYLSLIGAPVAFGLLLGGMEWLVSASLYNALGIGAATYALTQVAFGFWMPRLTQSRKQAQELANKNEDLDRQHRMVGVDLQNAVGAQRDEKRENKKLKQDLHEARQECKWLGEKNSELRNQRDWLVRVRCRSLADDIDRLLKEWDRHDPKNREALRKYNNQLKSDVNRLINDMRNFGLPQAKVDDPAYLENPEDRREVQNLYDYLRWVYLGWPK